MGWQQNLSTKLIVSRQKSWGRVLLSFTKISVLIVPSLQLWPEGKLQFIQILFYPLDIFEKNWGPCTRLYDKIPKGKLYLIQLRA